MLRWLLAASHPVTCLVKVGLPVPWLVYTIYRWKDVRIKNQGSWVHRMQGLKRTSVAHRGEANLSNLDVRAIPHIAA